MALMRSLGYKPGNLNHTNISTPNNTYVNKTNPKILITGYARFCKLRSSYLPTSVIDIILHFYPKMNGYKFVWNVLETNITTLTLAAFDSDPFDIGLSNKFFLRLHSPVSKTNTAPTLQPHSPHSLTPLPIITTSAHFPQTHTTHDEEAVSDCYLTLLSFQLSPKCQTQIFHVELYCHELNEQCSVIWSIDENECKIQLGNRTNWNQPQMMYQQRGSNEVGINFMSLKWKLNSTYNRIKKYLLSGKGLTFECKVNLLKIISNQVYNMNNIPYDQEFDSADYDYEAVEYQNYDKMRFSWNVPDEYLEGLKLGRFNVSASHTRDSYNSSSYLAEIPRGISYHSDVYYDMFQLKAFKKRGGSDIEWMIQLCGLPKKTNSIGVKWEIFAMDKECKSKIISQIITFSYKMAVYKFSPDQNDILTRVIENNEKLILFCKANIVQKYDKKPKQNNSLHQPRRMYNYSMPHIPAYNSAVNTPMVYKDMNEMSEENTKKATETKTETETETDTKDNDSELSKQIISSESKIVQTKKDFFVWNITDQKVISKIKNFKHFGTILSEAFELFDDKLKFYIELRLCNTPRVNPHFTGNYLVQPQLQAQGQIYNQLQSINVVMQNLNQNMNQNMNCTMTLKVSMELIQTGDQKEFFQNFSNNTVYAYAQQSTMLSIDRAMVKAWDKLTLKISVKLIETKFQSQLTFQPLTPVEAPLQHTINTFAQMTVPNADMRDEKETECMCNKEVKEWLCEVVKLPQYQTLFMVNGIDDMSVVQSLNIEYLKTMGISLVGHQIKLLNAIKILTVNND